MLATVALAMTAYQATAGTPSRFDQADVNHDKFLSLEEINAYLVGEIFDSRDKNKDKRLTRAEWGTSIASGREKEFRDRDTNNDGVVTMEEALAYGRKKGLAKELLLKADRNKDGKLSFEEIKAYYASKEGPVR
jgi:hypothetical protein